METRELSDFTQAAPAAPWSATLALPAGEFTVDRTGTGVRHLAWLGGAALVAGMPRPEFALRPGEQEADAALALLDLFTASGVSGLRRLEGPWALLHWDADARELHLAVDRLGREPIFLAHLDGWFQFANEVDGLARRLGLSADPQRLAVLQAGGVLPAGQSVYPEISQLLPGRHLRLGADGSHHEGEHGTWRLEKRDRRPAVLVVGEFVERIKSVLRVLAESADLLLLAQDPAEGALLAAALAQLPGKPGDVLWVPGLSGGSLGRWRALCSHCGLRLRIAGEDDLAGRLAGTIADPTSASQAWLAAQPGLAQLAASCSLLDRQRRPGDRPLWLLSASGLDLALPALPWPVLNLSSWRSLPSQNPPAVRAIGERLAQALSSRWQPALAAAVAGTALRVQWPLLDETVCHFLANLPDGLRYGQPWSLDFRRRVLREVLPKGLR